MTIRRRIILFIVSAAALAAVFAAGFAGLPGFGRYPGPYGDLIAASVVPDRRVTNAPTAVNFDYRGFDTLGEEYILFVSIAALAVLLRREVGEKKDVGEEKITATEIGQAGLVQWFSYLLFGPMVVFGIYVILHGQLTPGGGFHGGVIVGSAWLLIYIAVGVRSFHMITPKSPVDAAEAAGAAMYAIIGLISLGMGGLFLQNTLPLGQVGSILSGGTIPLINFFVGAEVATAFMLVFAEFIERMGRG